MAMRTATTWRDRLAIPLAVMLAALTIGAAVYLLKPVALTRLSDDGSRSSAEVSKPPELADVEPDQARELARASELSAQMIARYRRGQLDAVSRLMEQNPAVVFSAQQQAFLDLEGAAARWFRQGGDDSAATHELTAVLERVAGDQALHASGLLTRAAELSRRMSARVLSARLYSALAQVVPDRADHWFERCAQVLGAEVDRGPSIACYEQAIAAADLPSRQFDLMQGLWIQRLRQGDREALSEVTEALLAHEPVTVYELQSLAALFLANERTAEAARASALLPDQAAR